MKLFSFPTHRLHPPVNPTRRLHSPSPPSAATKNMSSSATPFLSQIQSLLSRHRNAIFGRNFYSALQPDTTFRNSMYLEVLISVLLYYVRGYFPNLLNGR